MTAPSQNDIALIWKGFAEFYNRIVQTKNINFKELVKFMEPKFKAAGYREPRNQKDANILILTELAVGDFIVSTSTIREIRRIYPDAYITLLVSPRTFGLAEFCPYVNEIILSPQQGATYNLPTVYKLNMNILPKILRQRFDICFALAIHPQTPLLMYMSGAKIRIASTEVDDIKNFKRFNNLTQYLMMLSTHLLPCNTYGYNMADRFLALLDNLLHLPITNRKLEVWYTPADMLFAKEHLKDVSGKIYALSFGGTGPRKHYPPEKYVRLLEMILSEEPATTFVILGGGQYDLNSAKIIENVAPEIYEKNIIDLTNKANYRQSAAVLSLCDMYIGNDTGAMHVAAAVDCPVLMPNCFSADLPVRNSDTPRRWYPYGVPSVIVQPEHALPECKNLKYYELYGCAAKVPHCITQIAPETLFKGFHLLKERIAEKINEPLYMH